MAEQGRMFLSLKLSILIVVLFSHKVCGLECYQCQSVDGEGKNGITGAVAKLLGLEGGVKSDPHCTSPTLGSDLETVLCPVGQVCAAVRTSVTLNKAIFGEGKIQITARGCDSPTKDGSYCDSSADAMFGVLNGVANIATDGLVSTDGQACFCDTNLCVAGDCSDDQYKIFNYCVVRSGAIGGGIVLGLLALLILSGCCCCCCCCCCCRSKTQPVAVISLQSPSTAGNGGFQYQPFTNENEPA